MFDDKLLSLLKDCGAVQFGHFVLTSGEVSDYYVDIKKASTEPETLRHIGKAIAGFMDGYEVIAGMELGAVPLAVATSLECNKPFVIIRKGERVHGTGRQIEGCSVDYKKVLVVEDVATSGGSVAKAVDILRGAGAKVDRVVVVVDRESGARDRLAALDVDLQPLVTVSDILNEDE